MTTFPMRLSPGKPFDLGREQISTCGFPPQESD